LRSILFFLFFFGFGFFLVHAEIHTVSGDPEFEAGGQLTLSQQSIFEDVTKAILCACPGCVRMGLASCPCGFAKDQRRRVREKIIEGNGAASIVEFFIREYGTSILAQPPKRGLYWLAYVIPLLILVLVLGGAIFFMSKKKKLAQTEVQNLEDTGGLSNAVSLPDEWELRVKQIVDS
jgi:cytochrome c-type biogenesis protein CcmH/NrfF